MAETLLNNKHIIKNYNPKLFLALAAMTEGEDWIVGENPTTLLYANQQPSLRYT